MYERHKPDSNLICCSQKAMETKNVLFRVWDLTVKEGLGTLPESFHCAHIHGTRERNRAAELVEELLENVYYLDVSDRFYRTAITTEGLVGTSQVTGQLLRESTWPPHILQLMEMNGRSNAELLDSKKILLECHIADRNLSIAYILPSDRGALFSEGAPAKQIRLGENIHHVYSQDIYCKYLQVGICHHCSARPAPGSKLQVCSRCKKGCYCNRECQAADWPKHRTVCFLFKGERESAALVAATIAAAKQQQAAAGAEPALQPCSSSAGGAILAEEAAPP